MENVYKADPTLLVKPAYYSNGVPVFEPTMDEFRDFYLYNKAINRYGMQSGIVKVIPPPEWVALLKGTYTEDNLLQVKIRNPIVQNINVTAGYLGVFSLQNVERQRSYNIFQWKELLRKHNHSPPARRKSRGRGSSLPKAEETEETVEKDQRAKRSTCKSSKEITDELLDADFNIDANEFTPERCSELEAVYWKSVGYSEPMYGADMLGSLFLDRTTSWNVAHLPNVLDLMEEKIPGVNDAYLYAGLWKATFSWHLEDQDLYSINYLHFGAPKQWYSIPQEESGKFYNLMKEIFNEDYKNCREFLRHKTFMASPQFLQKHGITCNSIVHNQGEFMITYPYGYHSGYNLGYNLAESVNFALDDWFPFAEKTNKCECISDSVGINHKQIYCKFKGIPYVAEAKTQPENVEPPQKVMETPAARKPSIRKREKKENIQNQCALCPNTLLKELLDFQPFELLGTDVDATKSSQVHRICAEQFKDQISIQGKKANGLKSISKAQRGLKCQVCHVPNITLGTAILGACFQCSHNKCTRAFHATCAISGGVMMDSGLCKMHRVTKSPFYERSSLEAQTILETVQKDSIIQFTFTNLTRRRHSGEVYAGLVLRNNVRESTLEVLVYPNLKDKVEIQYDDILIGSLQHLDNQQLMTMQKRSTKGRRASEPTTRKRKRSPEHDATDELLAGPVSPLEVELKMPLKLGKFQPPLFDAMYQTRLQTQPQMVFINQTSLRVHSPFPEPQGLRFVEETFNDH